jgi:hypothetical protein
MKRLTGNRTLAAMPLRRLRDLLGEKTSARGVRKATAIFFGSCLQDFVFPEIGQAVVKVLRFDAAMRAWFKRIKRRRGSKIARVAVMRRLATILWHMLKRKQKYRYESPIQKHREFAEFEGVGEAA